MTKICGIYKITNKINGKCYIGQSNDINRRWRQELSPNAKLNPHLARAFEKYGTDNFEFEIIEECQRELLNEREQFWINIYNSADKNFGYNKTFGGDGNLGRHFIMSDTQKEKIRKANIGRKLTENQLIALRERASNKIDPNQIVIFCYETNKYYLSIGKAAEELRICKDSIRHVINGQDNHASNYRFCKISDNINEFIESCQQLDNYLNEHNITLKQYYIRQGKPNKKQVFCIETEQIFESASEAARQMNLNKHCIIWCCNGKYKQTGNYHFKYIEN